MFNNSLRSSVNASGSMLFSLMMALQVSGCVVDASSHGAGDTGGADDDDSMAQDMNNPPSDGTGTSDPSKPGDMTTTPNTPSGSPVDTHGSLKITGTQLTDKNGAPVQLRGMSLFWSQWAAPFYNDALVGTLAHDWHASLVRAAMGVESDGYLTNAAAEKAKVKSIVDSATANGIYVIIDWHDHNASQHTDQAKAFFTEMAQTYGKQPNVIFEIFNEPDYESWSEVKSYAEQVIGAIRGAGSDNVIVVGTPTWSQDVDIAAQDPITKYSNIAYTLHFYAGTHKQSVRDKAKTAMSKGIALFTTEWGTCAASGNGGLDLNESQTWLNFLSENKISWANWSLFDKNETASALVPGASPSGGWADSALTQSGKFVKAKILEGSESKP